MPTIGGSPPVVGTVPVGALTSTINASARPFLHRTLAQPLAAGGAQDRKLLLMGDSLVAGSLSSIVGQGPTAALVTYLLGEGFSAAQGLTIAQVNSSAFNDPRVTLGAGWTIPATGNGSAGLHNSWGGLGSAFNGAPAAATMTFTPAAGTPNYDSYDVYYMLTAAVANGFSVNFNGGANTIISQSTIGLFKTTVSGASTSRPTLNFSTITGFGALIVGWEPFLSTVPRTRVGCAGVLGSTSANWVDQTNPTISSLAVVAQYAPDTVIYSIGLNDLNTGVPVGTTIANIQTVYNAVHGAGGDLIIVGENPETPNPASLAGGPGQDAFFAAIKSFATGAGIGYIDIHNAWGGSAGFAALNAAGYYADALVHPSNFGLVDQGMLMGKALIAL